MPTNMGILQDSPARETLPPDQSRPRALQVATHNSGIYMWNIFWAFTTPVRLTMVYLYRTPQLF